MEIVIEVNIGKRNVRTPFHIIKPNFMEILDDFFNNRRNIIKNIKDTKFEDKDMFISISSYFQLSYQAIT